MWLAAPVAICAAATLVSWQRPTAPSLWFLVALAGISGLAAASFGMFLAPALTALFVAPLLDSLRSANAPAL